MKADLQIETLEDGEVRATITLRGERLDVFARALELLEAVKCLPTHLDPVQGLRINDHYRENVRRFPPDRIR